MGASMGSSSHADLLWLVLCSVLVLFMQAGFLAIEAGLTRTKNSINVAVKNLTDFGLASAVFTLAGHGIMFGLTYQGWFGLVGMPDVAADPRQAAVFLYQLMFCGTAVTMVSGAVAERMRFRAYVVVAMFIAGPLYCMYGHWVWNGLERGTFLGWLGRLGFVDFAGSSVVHAVGGWAALALVLIVGPRHGRFDRQGRPVEIPASNQPMAMLGTILLWIGWLGFTGGSTLALTENVPMVLINTVLGATSGLLSGGLVTYVISRRVVPAGLANGSLSGLVSVTGGCFAFSNVQALAVGATGAAFAITAERLLERRKIDDAVGAVPVHAVSGVWGTIAVGLFGNLSQLGTGLSRGQQIGVQALGSLVCFLWSFGLTYAVFSQLNRRWPLRISERDEHLGLNVVEHGAKNELAVLLQAMKEQADAGDPGMRAPVEPFTEVGQIATLYNHVLDSLQRAMATANGIVRQIHQGIVTISWEGDMLSVNPAGSRLFGLPAQTLVGSPIDQFVLASPEASSVGHPHSWMGELSADSRPREMVVRQADGQLVPVEVSVAPFAMDGDIKCTAVVTDIRARKQAEAELKQALSDAQAASRSKSAFLATMSHEIRTPMNGVIGMTEILLRSTLTLEQRQHAETVRQSATILLKLIDDILDFSKIEAGRMTIEPISFDPLAMARAVAELQRPVAESKGLTLSLTTPDPSPPFLLGDEGRVRQVLMNMVGNAIKFTARGEVAIEVLVDPRSDTHGTLCLMVRDQGIGIPADKLNSIFDNFTQAESSTNRRFGGTGLGLAICRQLLQLMGGTIEVESAQGQGSTFRVQLPLPVCAGSHPRVVAPRELRPQSGSFSGARVLVAEDNRINQQVARAMLKRIGCEPVLVNNGREALERAQAERFELILMDCQMPEMDGFEATAKILEMLGEHSPPIIAMTANAMRGDREKCLACGMTDFIAKPVPMDALVETLRRYLQWEGEATDAPEPIANP